MNCDGKICLECGTALTGRFERKGLLITSEPDAAYWKGRKLPMTKGQIEMLRKFLRVPSGQVSNFGIEISYERSKDGVNLAKVYIHRIRQILKEMELPIEIRNIHGFGYELIIGDD